MLFLYYHNTKTNNMGTLVIAELLVVLAMIFIGARVGGIGLGIYGMIGVFVLVFGFGLKPGSAPIDVMMIIVAVITAAAALQASGGLEYLVGIAAKFLRKHPEQITYFGPLTCWLFCIVAHVVFVAAYYFRNSTSQQDTPRTPDESERYCSLAGNNGKPRKCGYRCINQSGYSRRKRHRAGHYPDSLYSSIAHCYLGSSLYSEPRRQGIGGRPRIQAQSGRGYHQPRRRQAQP